MRKQLRITATILAPCCCVGSTPCYGRCFLSSRDRQISFLFHGGFNSTRQSNAHRLPSAQFEPADYKGVQREPLPHGAELFGWYLLGAVTFGIAIYMCIPIFTPHRPCIMSCCARMRSTVELLPPGNLAWCRTTPFPPMAMRKISALLAGNAPELGCNHGWHQNDNSFGWNDTSFYSPGAWKDDEDFWNPDR